MALSPMMQQYLNIKEQNKDCILFSDSEISMRCSLMTRKSDQRTGTHFNRKNCGLERAPMCGVPFHSAYI